MSLFNIFYFSGMRGLLLLFFCLVTMVCWSQEKLEFGDTGTTTKSPKYKPKHSNYKNKRPIEWVKNSPKGLLIGNPCMDDVIRDMGFVYVVQTKIKTSRYGGGRMNSFDRFWHNLVAKLRITFRNGPFWKFKLKKKRKECRKLTGDYVG